MATSNEMSPNARKYGVKFVVGTGATWMLNLTFGADFAASSSDDLNDWPQA